MTPPSVPAPTAPARRRRRRFGRLAWQFLLCLLVLYLLSEGGLYLLGFGGRMRYESSGDLLWRPIADQRANAKYTHERETIDAAGLRLVTGADAPSEGRLNVLCLGDSVTFGYSLSDDDAYPSVLQRACEQDSPGRWRFLNAGVNGYNLFLVRQRLVDLLEHGTRADIVLLGYCFNEWPEWPGEHFTAEQKAGIARGVRFKNLLTRSAFYNFATERLARDYFFKLRNRLMPRAAPSNPKAEGAASDWQEHYRRQTRALLDELAACGIPALAIVWPDRQRRAGPYRPVFVAECRRSAVPVLELDSLLEGRDVESMFFDFEHPRAATVRLFVEQGIYPFFRTHAEALTAPPDRAPPGGVRTP